MGFSKRRMESERAAAAATKQTKATRASTPSFTLPVPPMGRAYLDRSPGVRIEPAVEGPQARKYQCMNRSVWINDGEFKLAFPGRADNRLPVHLPLEGEE
jgi:hypothetical protein